MRRALVACGVAALALFLAAGQTWAHMDHGARTQAVPASAYTRSLGLFGLVALAGGVAVLATRGRARIPVGLALTASGATAAAQVLAAWRDFNDAALAATRTAGVDILVGWPVDPTPWRWVALAGGAVLAATGVAVTLRGPSWQGMSAKYDAPAAPPTDADVWAALDRGEDPTAQ